MVGLSPYSTGNWVGIGCQETHATYIGGNTNFRFGFEGNTNISFFRYQHVVIPNTKLWHWGLKPMRGPNPNGFASQWNIGFRIRVG